jgi:hypothetical protein
MDLEKGHTSISLKILDAVVHKKMRKPKEALDLLTKIKGNVKDDHEYLVMQTFRIMAMFDLEEKSKFYNSVFKLAEEYKELKVSPFEHFLLEYLQALANMVCYISRGKKDGEVFGDKNYDLNDLLLKSRWHAKSALRYYVDEQVLTLVRQTLGPVLVPFD